MRLVCDSKTQKQAKCSQAREGEASRGVVTLQYKIAVGMNEPELHVSRQINPQKQP